MNEGLDLYLVKEQGTFGTAETGLVGTDYFPALRSGSSDDVNPEFTPIDECSGFFDQDLSVRGKIEGAINLACYMRSLGVSTAPDFAKLAKACGLKETVTAVVGGNKYAYAPNADATLKDLTVWKYLGGAGTSGSILRKFGNVVGDWKLSLEAGKPAQFLLSGGKGQFVSEAAATLPTPTKSRTVYPALVGATISINGLSTYKLIKIDFEGGNKVDQYIDPSQSYGLGQSDIGEKKIKFSMQLYADPSIALPSASVIADAVESSISITWGVTNNKINVAASYPQFNSWKTSKVGSLHAFDIAGICSQNNFAITVNNDLT